jgi:aspartate kinase
MRHAPADGASCFFVIVLDGPVDVQPSTNDRRGPVAVVHRPKAWLVGWTRPPSTPAARNVMPLVVQKYGGTSVGDASRIRRVAERVVASRLAGNDVVVVVSAMGDTTDDLIALARRVSPDPPPREMDMLLTAGERISMSLLAMAIADLGVTAKSFTGSQAGIITDTLHGKARILDVRASRISDALAEDNVVIVAGFQGVSSTSKEITTLGRGGSDTTAVALAAALGAGVCEIYTDVDGVYTADPRVVPEARKLHMVSYEEMLELSACGARVLMLRCVEYARRTGMVLHVRSSFTDAPGTWVREEDERMEKAIVSGVPHDTSEAKVTLVRVPDKPGIAARVMRGIAEHGVNVDMIVQNVSHGGTTDISFTVPKADLAGAMNVLRGLQEEVGAAEVAADSDIAKVSLVGAGMKSSPGVAAAMFDALAQAGVNIEMISTSTIRISCVIRAGDVGLAVRAIHDRFHLSEEAEFRHDHPDGTAELPVVR